MGKVGRGETLAQLQHLLPFFLAWARGHSVARPSPAIRIAVNSSRLSPRPMHMQSSLLPSVESQASQTLLYAYAYSLLLGLGRLPFSPCLPALFATLGPDFGASFRIKDSDILGCSLALIPRPKSPCIPSEG